MKIRFLILLGSTFVYGIVWSFVYLLFTSFHGMTKMFNEEFIFLIASLLHTNLDSITLGVTFAFLDGALLGSLFGTILIIIYKENSND